MSWIDDLSLDPNTDWTAGPANAVELGQKVTQRELDLAARARPWAQRVQMVQTAPTAAGTAGWTTLTSMSYAAASGGDQGVTGMGAISSGLLTMPTGSAGQWLVSGQVSVQSVTGLTAVRAAIIRNGARLIVSGGASANFVGNESASIPAFEFTVADGDTIGLQVLTNGANSTTATFTGQDGQGSFLRLQKLS